MDVSAAKWLSEMELEDPSLLYQSHMDFLHDPIPEFTSNLTPQTPNLNLSSFLSTQSLSDTVNLDSYTSQTVIEIPAKQQKTNHWNLNTISQKLAPKSFSPSFSNVISFRNHSNTEQDQIHKTFIGNIINSSVKSKEEPVSPTDMASQFDYRSVEFVGESKKVNITRSPLQAKDHVIAERKRREKLNQSFLSLSTLLPGLKKLDKATILGNAIQHIKELQEKTRDLEEETMRKNPAETTFARVTKSCTSSDDDTSSVDNFKEDIFAKQDVEVEVRVHDNNVLIRVNCEKENGIMGRIFGEVEKFNMIVINSNAMPFGLTSVAISIVAQVEGIFPTSAKDLANNLRAAFRN